MGSSNRRAAGPDPLVGAVAIAALLVTVAIALLLLLLRGGLESRSELPIFYRIVLAFDLPAAFAMLAALSIGLWAPIGAAGSALAQAAGRSPLRASLLAGGVLALGAYFGYGAYPLTMDEFAPFVQSQAFVAGRLTGAFPPDLVDRLIAPRYQGVFFVVSRGTGEFASIYLPGFALLLSPFTAIGLPWLANPVIGVAAALVIHRLALELTGSRCTAGSAMLLALASPAFSINAMSFYSMPAHLLCNACFALLLLAPGRARAFLAGLVGGLALNLHNPVPHALFALPWIGWLALREDRWRTLVPLALGYLPWVLGVWFGWLALLGSLASVADPTPGVPVGVLSKLAAAAGGFELPARGLLWARVFGIAKVWLWSVPALCVVAALAWRRDGLDVRVRLLFVSAVATLAGYLFVPFDQGHGWGFRYFHSAWFVLPVLAAIAAGVGRRSSLAGYLHGAALASLVVSAILLWFVHGFIADHRAQLPAASGGSPRVWFVDTSRDQYAVDLVRNDPYLQSPTVVMRSLGPLDDAALIARRYPGLVKLGEDRRGSVWGLPD